MEQEKKVILLAGPTASGKSLLAIKLAHHFNSEIINADSMQIYKEISILTSRPNIRDTKIIKHHLYGFNSVKKNFSTGHWLKMTIKEVKDEHKDTDGSPEVKQKIRKLQNEIANRAATQSAALDNVKDASAVITNPTHFAVAIKYEVGSEGAPIILAMGRGMIAEKIIKLADENKVTVFQSPLLARALYFTGEIGKEISENLYSAVASVLAYIFKIERGEETDYPEFEIPENMSFDEYGKTIK